jgi:hypothetical protein
MTQQIHPDQTFTDPAGTDQAGTGQASEPAPASRMSRRSMLRGAAGAGAVGLAAAAGTGAFDALPRPHASADLPPADKPVTIAPLAPAAVAGPLVVYLADTTTGEFDVFGDTGQVRVKNPALVSQLLKNLPLAQQ